MESIPLPGTEIKIKKPIFYIYDERMLAHKEYVKPQSEDSSIKISISPEVPERVSSIFNHLKNEG